MTLKRRVANLEARLMSQRTKYFCGAVVVQPGETVEQAIARTRDEHPHMPEGVGWVIVPAKAPPAQAAPPKPPGN